MKVAIITHPDFTITVDTQRLGESFARAKERHVDIYVATKYWLPKEASISIWNPTQNNLVPVDANAMVHPVFFENKWYQFAVEFKPGVSSASVRSRIKEVEELFSFRKFGNVPVLSGSLNFGNDIGRYQFTILYDYDGFSTEASFGFEVFPVKLDYRNDYQKIVTEIQEAYPNLVFDFLKKTYQQFNVSGNQHQNEFIWWAIFQQIFNELVNDINWVLKNPHRRLQQESMWLRAEQIRRTTPVLEEEVRRFRQAENRRYLVHKKVLKADIYENRFVKAALGEVMRKFLQLQTYMLRIYAKKITNNFQEELKSMERSLQQLQRHPFFREIGHFEGFRQESLVLQKKKGYSGILKNWILLKKGFSFFEGATKLEFKDIAELYEIWCFLEMKKTIQRMLNKEPSSVELAVLRINQFQVELREGKRSRITFAGSAGEEIELYHELSYFNQFDSKNKTGSYTVTQRPDIVLRITKNDLKDDQVFTYLFDAKYRLASDDDPTLPDAPPEDAINQMHRYRDAIYFEDNNKNYKAKEVIGGYILYPGRDDVNTVITRSKYYKSIEQINIGAFPLLPGYPGSNELVSDYLSSIMLADSEKLLKDAPPLRGKEYQPDNAGVLIGLIAGTNLTNYAEYLKTTTRPELSFYQMPLLVSKDVVRYFAPYLKGKGVRSYYRITGFRIDRRDKLYADFRPLQKKDSRTVYVVSLELVNEWKEFCQLEDGRIRLFRYARLSDVHSHVGGKIRPTLRDELLNKFESEG